MLCRFDRVEGEGLFGLAGFIELDDKTPAAVATLILQRLAVNEGNPKDYYTRDAPAGPDWPEVVPSLDWPVADHSEARSAFAQLITRAPRSEFFPSTAAARPASLILANSSSAIPSKSRTLPVDDSISRGPPTWTLSCVLLPSGSK
jgi:hypothetical protein